MLLHARYLIAFLLLPTLGFCSGIYNPGSSSGGSGGGASSLAVNQNGVQITSPTVALNFIGPPFLITSVGGGTTAQINLNSSSVTLQGNSLLISNMLTQSSATATYLQNSSATITYLNVNQGLTQSSATLTYLNKLQGVTNVTGTSPINSSGGLTPAISLSQTIAQPETFTSSVTITNSLGAGITYNVNVGSMTGAGLSTCGDGTHALNYVSGTGTFGCQALTSGGGGGGSSSLAVTTGAVAGFTGPPISSPTAVVEFDSATFQGQLTGSATAFIQLNSSSVTLQGNSLLISNMLTQSSATATYLQASSATATYQLKGNYLTGNQTITLSADATGSGATSIAVTNAARQNNITTFGASSTTFASNVVMLSSVSISSNTFIAGATFYQLASSGSLSIGRIQWGDGTIQVSSPPVGGGGGVSSVSGTAPINSSGGSTPAISLSQTIGQAETFTSTANFSSAVSLTSATIQGIYLSTSGIKTGNYTATATDTVILSSAIPINFTITLPVSSNVVNQDIFIKKVDSSTNVVNIVTGVPTDSIEGSTYIILGAQYQPIELQSLGNGVWIVKNGQPFIPGPIGDTTGAAAAAVITASQTFVTAVNIPYYTQFSNMVFGVGGAVGGTVDMGVYSSTGSLIVHGGPTVIPSGATSLKFSTMSVTNLTPGTYYLALKGSNTNGVFTATFTSCIGAANAKILGRLVNSAETTITLPTTISLSNASWSTSGTPFPCMQIEPNGNSVPLK